MAATSGWRCAFCTLADSTRHWHPWAQDRPPPLAPAAYSNTSESHSSPPDPGPDLAVSEGMAAVTEMAARQSPARKA